MTQPQENEYLNCIRCGLCLAVCPTYGVYKTETSSPRGRVALARKSLEGELELTANLTEQMYACLDCLACNDICPVGIRPADLALEMRHVQEQIRPSGWKDTLFGGIISRPGRMEAATLPLRIYQRSGLRHLVYTLQVRKLLPARLRDLEGMLPRLPRRPLRQVLPEVTNAHSESRYRVGFFLGCAQSLLFADESAATVRVLARNGCTVVTPKDTVCCGMPVAGYGRMDLAKAHARFNIALFETTETDVIVTDCATCGSKLKEYGQMLADEPEWAERAVAFSAKVRDISEFLMSIPLEKPAGRIEARVTYHDPCHLRRAQKVWQQPRALMQLIDGIDLVELPKSDWCCGSAGSQLITHYETSLAVLDRKMDNLKSTGAEMIASGCPGCQMQLTTGIKRRLLDVKVVHPIVLLDQAYAAEENPQ
ncbi:MAG: (Fe-S)-binding protein [Bellilinea sp.]